MLVYDRFRKSAHGTAAPVLIELLELSRGTHGSKHIECNFEFQSIVLIFMLVRVDLSEFLPIGKRKQTKHLQRYNVVIIWVSEQLQGSFGIGTALRCGAVRFYRCTAVVTFFYGAIFVVENATVPCGVVSQYSRVFTVRLTARRFSRRCGFNVPVEPTTAQNRVFFRGAPWGKIPDFSKFHG